MRLASVFVQNFRGFSAATTLEVEPGLNVVVGANGQGKSSLLNAIEWCLYGREIEKTSSGLVERKAWEVANRYSPPADTVVRLTWELADGRARMTRVRRRGGKRTEDDLLQVELPSGELRSGGSVDDWASAQGIPSWAEWRSSYCQHQEAARDRLLTKENRTAALVSLLGLDEIAGLKADLDGLKFLAARRSVKAAEDRIAADLQLLQSSAKDLDAAAQGLEARGIAPASVTASGVLDELDALRASASSLALRLGLSSSIPDSLPTLDDGLEWAGLWPSQVTRRLGSSTTDVHSLRRQAGEIEAAVSALEPLDEAAALARRELAQSLGVGGDADQRREAVRQAEEELQRIEGRRKATNRLAALLADARGLSREDDGDECPVCRSHVPNLDADISRRLDELGTSVAEELERASSSARTALQAARDAVALVGDLERRVASAESNLESRKQQLRTFVPGFDGTDVAAAARARLEEVREAIADFEQLQNDVDRRLVLHRETYDDARAKARYLEALDQQDRHIDVEQLPAWADYNDALDDLVALIADCEALAITAKDVLASMSEEKLAQVNQTLGSYYQMITGASGDGDRGLKVVSHSTAKQLDYRIVDDRGEELVPILNQASLNAISIALLFAQAAGAAGGGPSLLVLDDPEQSLDEDHIAGLARALDRVADHRDILIGITPARLEERLRDYSLSAKHFHYLRGWTTTAGAVLT